MSVRPGDNLGDRYRIERELGQGGMATVYLAEDIKHQRMVAVKVLKPQLAAAVGGERFLREITTTANLRHPNILPLFDSGEADGLLYYVMPYVEGETLRERMTREGALPLGEALRIADEVADALHYAHTRNIIHRDIKPENILLENEHAIVADFGIANAISAAGDEKLTVAGMALGTPLYMSPEQGNGEADARSDLYALGCVMYEMLAGSPPFNAPTPIAVIVKHSIEPVPSLQAVRPDVTGPVAAAVERALAKAPADRFGSLQEFRAAIRVALVSGTDGGTPYVAAIDKPPPRFATSLLGRDIALESAADLVRSGARVLSVTGYGGTGKTRFAAALQQRVSDDYDGGTAFISLASVTDPAEVMSTIGGALDIAEAMGRTAADAVATLIGGRRVLLVLDNLEQVVEAAEDIAALVARCEGLQIIATSRRPLRIGAEVEIPLPPLDVPSSGASVDDVLACAAVTLFVERAQKARPGFAVTAANADAVAGICRSLDGLPLALELAAARVRILEPAALLQRLDHALDLLTSGDRDLPLRQRTLRATISWSYSLLTPEEQRLLRRLSVFHEGWTLDALEHVCYDDDRWRALDDLASLVEKGLVRVTGSGERYTLLETIRAFGAEQLHAAGEVEAARDAHADYFLALAEEVDAGIQGTTQREAMQRAKAENANFFAALARLVVRARLGDADAVEKSMLLCGALGWYWHIAGLHLVGHEAVESMIALADDWPPSRGRGRALFTSGMISAVTGDMSAAIAAWIRMGEDGHAIGDSAIEYFARGGVGYALLGVGRFDEAAAPLNESVQMLEGGSSDFLLGVMLTIRGLQRFIT
ncbi:MAG: protein kinase, partial [Longimicrobiales bacterium]